MYEGETEPIPRVTDPAEPEVRDRPGPSAHHHHHHDHSPPPPASRRVRTLVAALLIPFALAAAVGTILLFPFGDGPQTQGGAGRPVHGVITAAQSGSCTGQVQVGEQPDEPQCLVVTVRMTDGEAPGAEIGVIVPQEPSTPRFAVDDEVVLSYGGSDPRQSGSYQLVDFQRDVPLALLAGLFAVAVLVLGRWQGLKALIALGLSFLVLVFFVLPAILGGESPLLVAVCGAGVIMFVVLYLTHGFSARTSTAVLGTMVSLALIGVLGALWAAFAKLTGLDEETATLVGLLNAPIDTRGLLLAGVVIGALGVLDDVTVTQTSAVWELRAANPLLTRRELYTSALRIGRDHVASAVNTLVMAYAGAALPMLLYSSISGVGLGSILTSQSIAQELVRTLVGSIGLVAAVPITTALAAAVAAQEPAPEPAGRRDSGGGWSRTGQPGEHQEESGAGRPGRNRARAERGDGQPDRSGRGGGGQWTRRAGDGEGRGGADLPAARAGRAGPESGRSGDRAHLPAARTHDTSHQPGNDEGRTSPGARTRDTNHQPGHTDSRTNPEARTRDTNHPGNWADLPGARTRETGGEAGRSDGGSARRVGGESADRAPRSGARGESGRPDGRAGVPAGRTHGTGESRRSDERLSRARRSGRRIDPDRGARSDESVAGGLAPGEAQSDLPRRTHHRDGTEQRRGTGTSPQAGGPPPDQRAWFDDDLDDQR